MEKNQDETSIALLKKIAELIQPKKKENKPVMETLKKNTKKEIQSLPFIEKIEDEKEHLNYTQNPTEEKDETDNGQWIKLTKEQATELLIFSFDLLETDDLNNEDIEEVWINAWSNMATDLAIKENTKKDNLTTEDIVPPELHNFIDIFSEEKANQFLISWPWDHKIEMKDGFESKSLKLYNLTLEEQIKLDKFLKENLEKGYIWSSESLMASPFFFVKKKDGKQLQPCQDYRYLNEWTQKNTYPLPLISKIMDKFKDAKYFTKLDIWWGYNNIQIKEGNE